MMLACGVYRRRKREFEFLLYFVLFYFGIEACVSTVRRAPM